MGGIIKKGLFRPEEIMASDIWEPARERTQKEVADQLGISQSYISRLEKRIIDRLKKEILRMM